MLSHGIYGIIETAAFFRTNNFTMRMLFEAFSLIVGLGYQLLMHRFLFDGGKQKSMIMQKFKDKVEHEKLSFGWHNYCVTGIFNLLGRNLRLSIKICFTIK